MPGAQFSGLYIVSFVVITVGFVMFNSVPTYTPIPDSDSREASLAEPLAAEMPVETQSIKATAPQPRHPLSEPDSESAATAAVLLPV